MSHSQGPSEATFATRQVDGHTIWTTRQVKTSECGPCALGIVLRQIRHPVGRFAGAAELRAMTQQFMGGYRPHVADLAGAVPTPLALPEVRARLNLAAGSLTGGTQIGALASTLNARFTESHDPAWDNATIDDMKALKRTLRAARPTSPLICQIEWDSGERHFIVACGASAEKDADEFGHKPDRRRYWFSDPYYGLQTIQITSEENGSRLTYWPGDGATGGWGTRGRFTGQVVFRAD
jgi:hypothetical protein